MSTVLDISMFIGVSWHHTEGKKKKKSITWKDFKLYWEETDDSFIYTLLQKYSPLRAKVF